MVVGVFSWVRKVVRKNWVKGEGNGAYRFTDSLGLRLIHIDPELKWDYGKVVFMIND